MFKITTFNICVIICQLLQVNQPPFPQIENFFDQECKYYAQSKCRTTLHLNTIPRATATKEGRECLSRKVEVTRR
jgi:hypothetical protein